MSTVYQNRHAHLRDFMERFGGGTALAAKIGLSKQLISNYGSLNPQKQIGSKIARRIEAALGYPIGYMDSPLNTGVPVLDKDDLSVSVPLLNVTASMGPGAQTPWHEEAVHQIRVSKTWIRNNTQASSFDRLAVITARGDSMEPTFSDGSVLLVDTAITAMRLDAVYVILKGEDLYIKRIQRNMDGTFDVISDNQAYRTMKINDPYKEGFLVMGRVLVAWNPRKL